MFKFKQFTIDDSCCAMKIGTDGVLLGAWVSLKNSNAVLDIGTGSGLIALQIAQRCDAEQIDALEIDGQAYEQAVYNFENSDWGDRLFCYHSSFVEFVEEIAGDEFYDTIVCNPPFYVEDYQTPDTSRNTARFQDALPFEHLLQGVSVLLTGDGNFSVIIPYAEEDRFLDIAKRFSLHPNRITRVRGHEDAPLKRSLIQLSKNKKELETDELIIEVSRHNYTQAYKELVKDFYLKL